jgi:hypothetical protein
MAAPAPGISADNRPTSEALDTANAAVPGNAGSPDKTASNTAPAGDFAIYPAPPAYFIEALADAERLLKYAAEIGVDIDDKTRSSVLEARLAVTAGWNTTTAANLLAALTRLAAQLRPVTAESLRTFDTRPTVRTYWTWVICLAVVIVPFSLASFISSAISNTIRSDIASANDLTVKLTAQFGPFSDQAAAATLAAASGNTTATASLPPGISPADVLTELQTFAAQIRAIYARSRQLNRLILGRVWDPLADQVKKDGYKDTFELPVPLPVPLGQVVTGRVSVYQDARYFGQEVTDDVSVFYGAIATCILPVLYALLGTCAFLLRSFSQEMSSRTFVPSHSDSARFLIAAIVGGVVGLFNNFTFSQGASIPPLAIAFVVGYAVDVFFSFLEGLIQAFTKSKNGPNAPSTAPAAS